MGHSRSTLACLIGVLLAGCGSPTIAKGPTHNLATKRNVSGMAQGRRLLNAMFVGARWSFEEEIDVNASIEGTSPMWLHRPCKSAPGPVPAVVPKGAAVAVPSDTWSSEPWSCLRFAANEPLFFQLDYRSSGTGEGAKVTATAVGDVDGDGRLSMWMLTARENGRGELAVVSIVLDGRAEDCSSGTCVPLCHDGTACGEDAACQEFACKPLPAGPKASEVCARATEIWVKEGKIPKNESVKANARCTELIKQRRQMHPERYPCDAECIMKSSSTDAAEACSAKCTGG